MFRCIGDDRQMGYLLVDYLYRKLGHTRVGIIRASNRYGRFGVREIKRRQPAAWSARSFWRWPTKSGPGDFALQLDRLAASDVEAVVHWGDAVEGALILNEMRARGMEQPYYACDRCVSDEFLHIAGGNAEGIVCGYPWDPTRRDTDYLAFVEAYRRRFGLDPDTYSAHAYDGHEHAHLGHSDSRLEPSQSPRRVGPPRQRIQGRHRRDSVQRLPGRPGRGLLGPGRRRSLGVPLPAKTWTFREGPSPRGDRANRKTAAAPEDVTEVKIGWFGPTDPDHPTAGQMWQAATLAIEEANADGGCGGLPVRLVSSWSADPLGHGCR